MNECEIDNKAIIQRLKESLGLKKDEELAQYLGIEKAVLSNWKTRRGIKWELLFSKCKHLPLNWILYGDEMADASIQTPEQNIPMVALPLIPFDAVAGLPTIDNIGIAFADCEQYVIPEFAARGAQYLVRVSGSSMYPKYSNGDILACRIVHELLFFQWGKVYVIDSSQGVLVKRIQPSSRKDHILLVSDNKDNYPPFDFPTTDIRSIAIVVGVIRFE